MEALEFPDQRNHSSTVNRLEIPVIHSLLGVDLLPYNHPMRVGMIGTYGNRWANIAMMESDFILVLGSRLDVRQTGSSPTSLVREKFSILIARMDN